jgi:hypothetical protein
MEKQTENNLDELIQQYIDEMTTMEKLVMEIARDHLESSFSIENSVGFVIWLREKNKRNKNK